MKSPLLWLGLAVAALWLAAGWRPEPSSADGIDTVGFGKLPVLAGGRVKPFDTLARNSLMILNGAQSLRTDDGGRLGATRWLVDVMFRPAAADAHPSFLIHNPEVLGLIGGIVVERKRFSYAEIEPHLAAIDEEGRKAAEVEAPRRTPFHVAVLNLRNGLILYQHLRGAMRPADAAEFAAELEAYDASLDAGRAAMRARGTADAGREALNAFVRSLSRYEVLARNDHLRPVPPADEAARASGEWQAVGASLVGAATAGGVDPVVLAYARLGDAVRAGDAGAFNAALPEVCAALDAAGKGPALRRTAFERLFNHLDPFYRSMGLYVLATLLACLSWLAAGPELRRTAVLVLVAALAIHSFGLVARMVLQGRPPVTNLYSSAVFIGWGTVVIGLVLERMFKDGIGAACSGAVGFVTLVIAHHLAGSGDTLEMLQAVLDTNFWLATHVITITAGYSAMFLAGMLAILFVLRGVCTRSLTTEAAESLNRMVYGVLCFATLFSFLGTVLGGIWADQSWGRFWGWDPKENGALLIVLWCAIILHARWSGRVRSRGLMIMAIFGNVITSFSWFGVNMLGVGLHTYGFMNKAFPWLVAFMVSQFAVMALAALPPHRWRSARSAAA